VSSNRLLALGNRLLALEIHMPPQVVEDAHAANNSRNAARG